jgi:hypothetical protein
LTLARVRGRILLSLSRLAASLAVATGRIIAQSFAFNAAEIAT